MNCPIDKFDKVMDYVMAVNKEEKVTVEAICKYFEEDPKKILARRKKSHQWWLNTIYRQIKIYFAKLKFNAFNQHAIWLISQKNWKSKIYWK